MAPDGVELVSGVEIHRRHLPQALAAVRVVDVQAQQLVVEILPRRQPGVLPADREVFAL